MFVYPPVPHEIIEAICTCSGAAVLGHVSPDGDCIHSQIAMKILLQSIGIESYLINAGPFDRTEIRQFTHLFASHLENDFAARNPLVFIVDCSSLDRIGYLSDEISGLQTIVIDHHASGAHFGDLCYIVPQSYSTSLCVMQLYKALQIPLAKESAEHIFFGLATDTGFLRFIGPNRGETFYLIGELVEQGVSPNDVYSRMEGRNTLASQRFLGKLLLRAKPMLDGNLMVVWEEPEDLEEFGEENRPSDALYARLLSIEYVKVVLYFKIAGKDRWEIGFRASHDSSTDVGLISEMFHGGGHRKAAGATVTGTFEQLLERLLPIIEKHLAS